MPQDQGSRLVVALLAPLTDNRPALKDPASLPVQTGRNKMAAGSPAEVWGRALASLKMQMTRATFDTWLARTWVVQQDGDEWLIGVPHPYALDWLSHRLAPLIARTLSWTWGAPATVRFVLGERDSPSTDGAPALDDAASSDEASSIDEGGPVFQAVPEERVPAGEAGALVRTDFYIKLKVAFRKRALGKLKGAKLSVFLCLSLHVDRDGIAKPGGIETIMRETGYSRSAVCSALKDLGRAGLIRKLRQHQGADQYQVLGYAWFGQEPAPALWELKSEN